MIDVSRESRFLSLILRHKPDEVGLKLGPGGWVRIDELLGAMKRVGRKLTRDHLIEIVEQNDKKRFTISSDGERIRAAQGHSIDVDLDLPAQAPPDELFHGTARAHLGEIFSAGIIPGRRQQVHLSVDIATALTVGGRHGKPVVLTVAAKAMNQHGHKFYRADNGVWLTDHVPTGYLSFATI